MGSDECDLLIQTFYSLSNISFTDVNKLFNPLIPVANVKLLELVRRSALTLACPRRAGAEKWL